MGCREAGAVAYEAGVGSRASLLLSQPEKPLDLSPGQAPATPPGRLTHYLRCVRITQAVHGWPLGPVVIAVVLQVKGARFDPSSSRMLVFLFQGIYCRPRSCKKKKISGTLMVTVCMGCLGGCTRCFEATATKGGGCAGGRNRSRCTRCAFFHAQFGH